MESALKYPDLKVKVNCVPFCEEDCISLALLAKKRKIDVRFIEMMPIGNGKNFNGKMSEEIYKLLHNEFGDYEIYKKSNFLLSKLFPMSRKRTGRVYSFS